MQPWTIRRHRPANRNVVTHCCAKLSSHSLIHFHSHTINNFKIHFNIILKPTRKHSTWPLPVRSSHKNYVCIFPTPCYMSRQFHLHYTKITPIRRHQLMLASFPSSIFEFLVLIFGQSLLFFLFPHKKRTLFLSTTLKKYGLGHGCTAPRIPNTTTK